MKIVIWNQRYSVSVKSIDQDHQKLFELINQLFEAMTMGQGKSIISTIVDELERYTVFHFNREETFFRTTGYPRSNEHIAEHNFFKQKVSEFKQMVDKSDTTIAPDVLTFLRNWLVTHIANSDKGYADHFKKYGIQ